MGVPWWPGAVRVERCGMVMRGYAATWWLDVDVYGCGDEPLQKTKVSKRAAYKRAAVPSV